MAQEIDRNIRLPVKSWDFKMTKSYVGAVPDPEWRHAPEAAHETFRDMKFGVRIHWGIYSIWELQKESWPFLDLTFEKRQEYPQLYKTWNPEGFDAEEWMQFFARAGFKCFTFTTKHHEGFSMFETQTRVKRRVNWTSPGGPQFEDCDLAYSIMETTFARDVV
jgi:alpha-L-fucosidase